jgi:phage terminase large subunit-like protein
MGKRQSKSTIVPVDFIDHVIKRDEKGEPFSLAPYQPRVLEMALRRDPSGELVFRLVVLSEPKKSEKTFMAACLALWWAVTKPWQDQEYYDQQRKILRPAQFSRLHENQWVSSESRFYPSIDFDSCVQPGLKPDPTGALFIGIDASVKHDSTALCCREIRYAQRQPGSSRSSYLATWPGITNGF